MRYRDALAVASAKLAGAGIATAALDARLLLQHADGCGHAALISRMVDKAPAETLQAYETMVTRRLGGEPVSRIVGRREFFGLDFAVTPAVLDPRPETELLVERVLGDREDRQAALVFADVGTGSGAITIALLVHLPQARCMAIDVSADALGVAADNARANGVGDRIEFVRASYLEGIAGPFDFVVSNPPYIAGREIATLEREVREHDPRLALDGGEDGLDAYRALLGQAGASLKSGGRLYLEIGKGQADAIAALAAERGWRLDGVIADLAGIERVLVVKNG
ncbi:MAG: peptide chain release factor N(5)-glutamine methyltransferase [Nitratireductor sp.]|nr:peptide chain release factor N(5)-glutamine methyltransferase [Nitratireductor sp.]